MNNLRLLVNGCLMVGVTGLAMASVGCATHERVVVRERPAVVQERVVVEHPVVQERVIVTQPVVQERVIVRP